MTNTVVRKVVREKTMPLILALMTLMSLSLVAAPPAEAQTPPGEGTPVEHQDEPLEAVRAAYAARNDKDMLLLADRALARAKIEEQNPRVAAELHYWRGVALRRMSRADEALVAFERAEKLGLKGPELSLERGLANRTLGKAEQAEKDYRDADNLLLEDPEKRLRLSERWRREAKEEPRFQVWLTPVVGYDTNVVGVSQDVPLLEGNPSRNSFYYGAALTAKFYLIKKEDELLSLDYRNDLRAYTEDGGLSYTDNTFGLTGRYPVLEWTDMEVRGSISEAFIKDGGHARGLETIAPAFLFHPFSSWQARLWGDWSDVRYYESGVPPVMDRDGTITRVGLSVGIDLGRGWSAGPGAYFADYKTKGDDYDHHAWTATFALTAPEFLGCVASPSLSYTWDDYQNPNSLSGFTEKRQDRILAVGLTIKLRFLEEVIKYAPTLTVAYVDHRSNIAAFDYSRWEPRLELALLAVAF
jgi:tetratricopeptide (TPR) repeat protein